MAEEPLKTNNLNYVDIAADMIVNSPDETGRMTFQKFADQLVQEGQVGALLDDFSSDVSSQLSAQNAAVSATIATVQTGVDAALQVAVAGTNWVSSVAVATTGNITLSGEQTIEGVLTSASSVLVKNQTTPSQNGIYMTSAGAWTRRADADEQNELLGLAVFVSGGTLNGGKQYTQTTKGTITVGTTALAFRLVSDQSALNATLATKTNATDVQFLAARNRIAPTLESRRGGKYMVLARNAAGRVLTYFEKDGRLAAAGFRVVASAKGASRKGHSVYDFAIKNTIGRIAIGVDSDLRTFLRLNSAALTILRSDLNVVTSAGWRGSVAVMDVRATADLTRGTIKPVDGYVGPAAQRSGGALDTALAGGDMAVWGLHFYGQSNSGAGGTGNNATFLTAVYPHHVVQFSAGQAKYGTSAVNADTLIEIVPALQETGVPPYGAVFCGFAMEKMARLYGEASPAFLARTDWYGGEPLTTFIQGTTSYNNLIASITKAQAVLASYGRDYWPTITFVQGESGPNDRATYKTTFETMIENLRADVRTAVKKELAFIFFQINSSDTALNGAEPTRLAHLDAAKDYDGLPVALAGPMYQYPLIDSIHGTEAGRFMMSENAALALRSIRRKGYFRPLRPRLVARSGAVITVDYYNDFLPISIDADWILAAANYGFSYVDDASSATISSVAITGPSQIQVTLSGAPTGANRKLRYAMTLIDTTDDQWSSARGQIYASSGVPSPGAALGFTVPPIIRHYAAAFEETFA